MFPIVSSRVSFSARPLSDVAASRVPSVAAAARFLYSLSSRSRVWLRRSGTGPQEWTRQLQWEYIQLSFTPYLCMLQSWLHADAGSFDVSVVTCKPLT